MTNLRIWVVILTLTAFLAGLACGPFVSRRFLEPAPAAADGPFAEYERLMAQTFHLPPERAEPLRALLDQYRRDIESIKDRHLADYMSAMEPELSELGRKYRELIRDRVLPEAQRPEFDRLARELPTQTR